MLVRLIETEPFSIERLCTGSVLSRLIQECGILGSVE
jgi:hypothetical protein